MLDKQAAVLLSLLVLFATASKPAISQSGDRWQDIIQNSAYRAEQKENFKTLIEIDFYKPEVRTSLVALLELRRGLEEFRNRRAADPSWIPSDLPWTQSVLPPTESEYLRFKSEALQKQIIKTEDSLAFDVTLSAMAAKAASGFQGPAADVMKTLIAGIGKKFRADFLSRQGQRELKPSSISSVADYVFDKILTEGDASGAFALQLFGQALGVDITDSSRHPFFGFKKELEKFRNDNKSLREFLEKKLSESAKATADQKEVDESAASLELDLGQPDLTSETRQKKLEARESLRKRAIALRRSTEELNSFFEGAAALARMAGLKPEEVEAIDKISRLARSLTAIEEAKQQRMPVSEAAGYLMAVEIVWSFFKNHKSTDPIVGLGRLILQLAERLEDLRIEMHARFQSLDTSLARYFSQSYSILRTIEQNQFVQIGILGSLVEELRVGRREILAYMNALGERQADSILIKCLNSNNPPLDECLAIAALMSTKWSRDALSVPASYAYELKPGLQRVEGSLSHRLPVLERIRAFWSANSDKQKSEIKTTRPHLVNQDVWLSGANVVLDLFGSDPRAFSTSSQEHLEKIHSAAETLQRFYRTAVTDENGTLDFNLLGNLIRHYEELVNTGAQHIAKYLKQSQPNLPLESMSQPLPDEAITQEERERAIIDRQRAVDDVVQSFRILRIERELDHPSLTPENGWNELDNAVRRRNGAALDRFFELQQRTPVRVIVVRDQGPNHPLEAFNGVDNKFDKAPRLSDPGRGIHGNASSSLLTRKLTYCPGHKFDASQYPPQNFGPGGQAG